MSESRNPKLQPHALTSAQTRALRGHGHSLKAMLRLGQKGLTFEFVQSVIQALADHELIKVSLGADGPKVRKALAKELAEKTGSHPAQIIGRIVLLYRRRIHDPVIELPGKVIQAPQVHKSKLTP